ncbi:MAG: PBP1A family penicillin-binding protein [Bacillota bacterium]|nr:PBP1A family penicillin-binding protein [Bacillota bacterium]
MNTQSQDTAVRKKRKVRKKRRIFLSILFILFMLAMLGCLIVAFYVLSLQEELPDITAEDLVNAQTSFVYDAQGAQIAELHGGENRISVSLEDMPDYLIDALIASEDERFYEHKGVDFRSVMRALVIDTVDSLRAGEVTFSQGASTITMQLVRNVIDEREKSLPRKIKEALLALEFEKEYEKQEILYYYMNEIYIGPSVYGMQAASEYYFGKDVADISMSEAALLVGLIRNPGHYSPYSNPEGALNIRNTVLGLLADYDPLLYGSSAIAAKSDPLVVFEGDDDSADYMYPWFVDYVIAEGIDVLGEMGLDSSYIYTGGLRVYTTLDVRIQNIMEEAYANPENFPSSSTGDIVESAMAIVEPNTGMIRGLVGGREYTARRGFNRATELIRSPGSTIKPLVVYGPAVELGYGSGSMIDDSPVTYGSWSPNNDDHTFMGRITMRTAIMRSRNVCAVKMLNQIGVANGYAYGLKLGLPLDPTDETNLAMALGGLAYGVAPLDMAGAFATFASQGIHTDPYAITRIEDAQGNIVYSAQPERTEVFSAQTAYIVTDMLCSAVNGGTGTAAKISGWQTAGKTGTNGLPSAKDDPDYAGKTGTKDAWFCGYTPMLSAAVWMGYDNKKDADGTLQYLTNLYGGTYPARLFNTVMTRVMEGYEIQNFVRPDGVVNVSIDTKSGMTPSSLTPSTYISSELYNSNAMPGGPSDAWQSVNICTETDAVAGEFCPNVEAKVALIRKEGMVSEKAADYGLYAPYAKCSTHTTYQAGMQAVQICTDPRHNGEAVLANVAGSNGEGGCPSSSVATRYYYPQFTPYRYCALEDHQVSRYGNMDEEEDEDDRDDEEEKKDSHGNSSEAPVKLQTPSGLSVSARNGVIVVSWSATNVGGTIYVVERVDEAGNRERFIATGNSYTDNNAEEGVNYTYRVYAYYEAQSLTSDWSSSISGKL